MVSSGPRRILLTGDTVGGVWTFVTELSSSLIDRGMQVQLATIGPPVTSTQRELVSAISGLRWQHCNSKLEWMENPWHDIRTTRKWLEQVTREFTPDIVHLNTLSYGEVDFRAPVVQTIHSCVSSWWAEVKRAPLPAEWQQYRDHVEISLQGATILTAPSRTALLDVWKHYSVDPPDARSIYNGIDGTSFNSVEKESCILAAGRLWDEAKNLTALAEIAPQLAWPVYMAGNRMSPGGALNTFATCRLLGELSREELRSWYARAAIYVLPARYEPFGLSILEAALSGCALVLGDIPSLREIWADAATFVTPDDTESLRRAIQQLITHEAQRKQMAQRASYRAGQFSIRRMTNDYLDVYRSAFALNKRSHACAS